jgi:hypothetical protein
MQDFLRDEDPLSRTERRRVRASAPALMQRATGLRPRGSAWIRSRHGVWHLWPSPHSRFAPKSETLADASPRERIA